MIFIIFLYLGRLFIHLNIIIQVSQLQLLFFFDKTTRPLMLTSAFNTRGVYVCVCALVILLQFYLNHKKSG